MRRSGLRRKPGSPSLKRGDGLKRKTRLAPAAPTRLRPTRAQLLDPIAEAARRAWHGIVAGRPCAMCGYRGRHVIAHHVAELSWLKAAKVDERHWYDRRNALPLCTEPAPNRCHERHHEAIRRVPRSVVIQHAPRAMEFADEHGLTARIVKLYR